jgi:hypothetical protein
VVSETKPIGSKVNEKAKKPTVDETQSENAKRDFSKRVLMFVRHAERMDRVFPSWLQLTNVSTEFRPYDKNQPSKLVHRKSPAEAFLNDPPLTIQGLITVA